jgi:hypothetical protein
VVQGTAQWSGGRFRVLVVPQRRSLSIEVSGKVSSAQARCVAENLHNFHGEPLEKEKSRFRFWVFAVFGGVNNQRKDL